MPSLSTVVTEALEKSSQERAAQLQKAPRTAHTLAEQLPPPYELFQQFFVYNRQLLPRANGEMPVAIHQRFRDDLSRTHQRIAHMTIGEQPEHERSQDARVTRALGRDSGLQSLIQSSSCASMLSDCAYARTSSRQALPLTAVSIGNERPRACSLTSSTSSEFDCERLDQVLQDEICQSSAHIETIRAISQQRNSSNISLLEPSSGRPAVSNTCFEHSFSRFKTLPNRQQLVANDWNNHESVKEKRETSSKSKVTLTDFLKLPKANSRSANNHSSSSNIVEQPCRRTDGKMTRRDPHASKRMQSPNSSLVQCETQPHHSQVRATPIGPTELPSRSESDSPQPDTPQKPLLTRSDCREHYKHEQTVEVDGDATNLKNSERLQLGRCDTDGSSDYAVDDGTQGAWEAPQSNDTFGFDETGLASVCTVIRPEDESGFDLCRHLLARARETRSSAKA